MINFKRISIILTIFTLFFVICLLSIPNIILAATCSADCGGGVTKTCEGPSCIATDDVGCVGTDGAEIVSIGAC